MQFNNIPIRGMNRLHMSPIDSWKLLYKLMTWMIYLRVSFQLPSITQIYINKNPYLTENLKCITYKQCSFHGGRNTTNNIITCSDKIVIPSKLQNYAVIWYYTYLFHPGMGLTVTTIHQCFYQSGLRKSIRKEILNYGTCQLTKQ